MSIELKNHVSSQNACKACTPLGASLVFKGIEGAVPLLHGSQGCSTYMRRYIISHFKEPVDIASSNFAESSAVFGGKQNLKTALDNIIKQYKPKLIGIATTCLAETIGDNVDMIIHEYVQERQNIKLPYIVSVSTPSYNGTHLDGFHKAVKAVVAALSSNEKKQSKLNVFPGLISPAEIRYLKEIFEDFTIRSIILPDYSETLDSTSWEKYRNIPEGGTPVEEIVLMAGSYASIEFGRIFEGTGTASEYLNDVFEMPRYNFGIPIGIKQTDMFLDFLQEYSGHITPEKYKQERGRLVDSYFDGHKYVFGKKAVVYGEEDMVIAVCAFLSEIGIEPVLCVSGGASGKLSDMLERFVPGISKTAVIKEDTDFVQAGEIAKKLQPDIMIGNSKGYPLSKQLCIPLVRTGFPVHDRFGGQRLMHIGYRGTQNLFDTIVNTFIQNKQESSPVGYMYM